MRRTERAIRCGISWPGGRPQPLAPLPGGAQPRGQAGRGSGRRAGSTAPYPRPAGGRRRRAGHLAGGDAGDRGLLGHRRHRVGTADVPHGRPDGFLVRHGRHRRPGGQRGGIPGGADAADLLCAKRRRRCSDRLDSGGRSARAADRRGARKPRSETLGERSRRGHDADPGRGDRRSQGSRATTGCGPRRRGSGRPRPDHRGWSTRAPRGGRGGCRPAGTTAAARRALQRCRGDRRREAAARTVGEPGGDQPADRDARQSRPECGAPQRRGPLRLRPGLRGGHRVCGGWCGLPGRAWRHQRDRGAGPGRRPGHSPGSGPRVRGDVGTSSARPSGVAGGLGGARTAPGNARAADGRR